MDESINKIDRHLAVIKIQDTVYTWVFPAVRTAVDETAELVLAMESYAGKVLRQRKGLFDLFQDAMSRLLKHEALDALSLIDLLTLIYYQSADPVVGR